MRRRVSDWLIANKLTLKIKKTNFVIFHLYQRKINHLVNIKMFDKGIHELMPLDCKTHVTSLVFYAYWTVTCS